MALNREAVVRSAEKYVSKGKIDAAIREYRKVLQENPNDINTLNRVGDLYAKASRIDEAVKLFVQIAEQYAGDGFFVKAIAIYKKIIKLDPTRLEIYERLADLYARQGLKNEARGQFQVLADYYLKHNQGASAITIHLRMAELEPDNPSHHLKLAELYQSQQLWDKAIREYKIIAEMMLERGAVDEAAQVYQRAFEVKSDDLAFITDAVMGLKDAGHGAAAARLLAAAVQKNPQAERVARLAGFGREGDGRSTVAARPGGSPATGSRVPPPPMMDDDEFVVEIDDDLPGTLVAPPEGMDDRPGFGFRAAQALVEESELELEAELSFGDLDEAEEPVREPVALEGQTEEDAEEIEIELDLGGFDGLEMDSPAPSLEIAADAPEIAEVPELPDFGEVSFELDDEVAPVERDDQQVDALDETVGVLGGVRPAAMAPLAPAEEPGGAFVLDLDEAQDELELELDLGSEPEPEPEPELEPDLELELESEPELAAAAEVSGAPESVDEGELQPAASLAEVPEPAAELAGVVEPAELAEVPVAAVVPEPTTIDLLAEAEVFAKYGLEEKALDRVHRILEREPEHLAARCLEVEVLLKQRDEARLGPAVERAAKLASSLGDTELWPKLSQRLERAGYSFTAGRIEVAPTTAKKVDRISQLLGDLGLGTSSAKPRRAAAEPSVDSLLGDLGRPRITRPAEGPSAPPSPAPTPAPVPQAPVASPVEAPVPPDLEPSSPESVAAAPEGSAPAIPVFADPTLPLPRFDEDAFDDELPDIVLPQRRAPKAVQSAAEEALQAIDQGSAAAGADDGLDWLDAAGPAESAGEALFDDEDEFFDLAAELEQELDRDDVLLATGAGTPEEPSLEEIVEGFKKGVAEHLSEEDYDTHYNLGIAYREMGLIDEAVGEFQLSSKSPDLYVDSCAMLGLCFIEKGLPDLGVKWYQRALAHPGNSEEATLGLLYDLGSVYLNTGDEEAAYKTFVEVYGINSNYRDVVAVLEELKPAG